MITKVEEWLSCIEALRSDMKNEMQKPQPGDGFLATLNAFSGLSIAAEYLDKWKAQKEAQNDR